MTSKHYVYTPLYANDFKTLGLQATEC